MTDPGNDATERRFAPRWRENAAANRAAVARGRDAEELFARLGGRRADAFVAGAGPSLDDALPGILRFRDRFLLVCADAALRPLLRAGAAPDLVVSVDADPEVADLLAELSASGAAYLAPTVLHPAALARAPGETYFFQPLGGSAELARIAREEFPRTTAFPPKGNAGHQALLFACRLAAERVPFAGIDFGCPHDRFYARCVPRPEAALEGRAALLGLLGPDAPEALDVRGRATLTTPAFLRYAAVLQQDVAATRTRRILNCGGGILRRVPRATLEELYA